MTTRTSVPRPAARRSSYLAQRVQAIPPSGIRRFFELISRLDNVISLGVGEPDFATPWHIREAAIDALERGYTMYTANAGLPELRQAIAAHLARRYGVVYDPESEIVVTVGVSEGLDLALRAVLDPGDEVLVLDPGYVSYAPCTLLAGGVVVPVPTTAATGFQVQPADLAARITPRTKAILLGNPNNPTGTVLGAPVLQEIVRLAEQHDLLLISDEIYDRLVYGVAHTRLAALPGAQ